MRQLNRTEPDDFLGVAKSYSVQYLSILTDTGDDISFRTRSSLKHFLKKNITIKFKFDGALSSTLMSNKHEIYPGFF